jgi:hypothetical protein
VILAVLLVALLGAAPKPTTTPAAPAPWARRVAVTFDDLPGVSVAGDGTAKPLDAMTAKLVGAIAGSGAPVVGFVNEGKLYADERLENARVARPAALDRRGVRARQPHAGPRRPERGRALCLRGAGGRAASRSSRSSWASAASRCAYFRHPTSTPAEELAVRDQVYAFLAGRGYTVAPVDARQLGVDLRPRVRQRTRAQRPGAGRRGSPRRTCRTWTRKFDYFERQSKALFGREIAQVLLVHANSLNADHFSELAR